MVTPESAANRTCLINLNLDAKPTGKPIAGNRHDGFEVAETGNRITVRILRHSQRKRGAPLGRTYGLGASLRPDQARFSCRRTVLTSSTSKPINPLPNSWCGPHYPGNRCHP